MSCYTHYWVYYITVLLCWKISFVCTVLYHWIHLKVRYIQGLWKRVMFYWLVLQSRARATILEQPDPLERGMMVHHQVAVQICGVYSKIENTQQSGQMQIILTGSLVPTSCREPWYWHHLERLNFTSSSHALVIWMNKVNQCAAMDSIQKHTFTVFVL